MTRMHSILFPVLIVSLVYMAGPPTRHINQQGCFRASALEPDEVNHPITFVWQVEDHPMRIDNIYLEENGVTSEQCFSWETVGDKDIMVTVIDRLSNHPQTGRMVVRVGYRYFLPVIGSP